LKKEKKKKTALQTAATSIQLPLIILDPGGKLLFCNSQADELLASWKDYYGVQLKSLPFMKRLIELMKKHEIYIEFKESIEDKTYLFSATLHHDPEKRKPKYILIFRDITYEVKLSEDLHRSQEDYKALIETLPDIVWKLDSDFRFTYLSPQVERITGYSVSELAGKKLTNFLYDEKEKKRVIKRLSEAFKGEFKEPEMKASFRHKDGHLIFLESSFRLVYDKNNKIIGIYGVAKDITYRKMIEDNLRRMAAVYQNAIDAIFLFDRDAKIISCNAKFYETYNRNPKNTLGKTIYETICRSEDVEETRKIVREIFQGKKFQREWEDLLPDGSAIYLSTTMFPIFSETGKVLYGVSVNHDITERVRLENRLKTSEERYRNLADNINNIIFSFDNRGRFVALNKFGRNLLGINESDVTGKKPIDVMPPELANFTVRNLRKVLKNKRPLHVEEKVLIGGSKRYFITEYRPLLDEKGNLNQIIGVSHDVSEIIEARKKAEEASRMKSEFFTNVSHEIRTPLNAAIGFAYLIKQLHMNRENDCDIKDRVVSYANSIEEAGKTLSRVLEDILDMARIEAGKINIIKEKFSLVELVRAQMNIFLPQVGEKSLSYEFTTDASDYILYTDKARLGQILLNLIGNAVKFTKTGGVEVEIKTGKDVIYIMVKDTGIGISKKDIKKIFEPFIQTVESMSLGHFGTGLGLTISRKLGNLLEFPISCKSELYRGSVFTVEIPSHSIVEIIKKEGGNY